MSDHLRQAVTRLTDALAELAEAEQAYRYVHDCTGDSGKLVVGRAWDNLRRKGDAARRLLQIDLTHKYNPEDWMALEQFERDNKTIERETNDDGRENN